MQLQHNNSRSNPAHLLLSRCLQIVALILLVVGHAQAATLEEQIEGSLSQIRNIRVDEDATKVSLFNKQMDAAWQLFSTNKKLALPILRSRLRAEISSSKPSDLILLDIGMFVYSNDSLEGKIVAKDGLFLINAKNPVIEWNLKEFFEFVHAVAADHDPRVLHLIDDIFLLSDKPIFIPQHALKLDGTLICAFLYGVYGPESENHIKAKLVDKSISKRALELLIWLGSPASLPDVKATLARSPNYDTFSRVTAYMMQSAGPAGRDFLLKLDTSPLDEQSKQYLSKIRGDIQKTSFDNFKVSFARFPGDQNLSDGEMTKRLDAMMRNAGKDDRTSPVAILTSSLKVDYLIPQLSKVRSSMFQRLSDEALSDVEITNVVINALRYRTQ